MIYSKEQVQQLQNLLSIPKNVVIIPHKNPDGDAMGSCLGLSQILQKQGHKVSVVVPNDFPKFLKWLPQAKEVINSEFEFNLANSLIEQAEIIFLLDFNTLIRIDQLEPVVKESLAYKVLIDHHQQPDTFDFTYSDTQMPATCEMVYHFLDAMGYLSLLDKDIATCLMTGIITDTGSFRYPSVKPSTMQVVSELMKAGAQPYEIQNRIFDVKSADSLGLLGTFLDNMQYFPEYRTSIFTLSRAELEKSHFQKGDTDGYVNYGLTIQNNVLSVFFAEDTKHDFVKISFRSKGDFNVNELARQYFNGGGHINAAGGRSDVSLAETVKEFVNLLPLYKEQLQNTEI